MAYCLSACPSSSLSPVDNLLCNSPYTAKLSHGANKVVNFPIICRPKKPSILISNRLSVQELPLGVAPQGSGITDGNSMSSSKSVWVNPNSSRASNLWKKSSDFRYTSLTKVAESLNTCEHREEDILNTLSVLGNDVTEPDAVFLLNSLSNTSTARLVLDYFLERLRGYRRVFLYNVTLKVFRNSRDFSGSEALFNEILEKGIKPDIFTFSTIISCARLCNLPEKCVEWFERMPSFGCEPDKVTLSMMIHAYGRVGMIDTALSLYDRARSENWRLDAATFSTLIKIHGLAGNFDGCLNLYEEMKALKIKPNVGVYNSLLDAMGRAKWPWQAKTIYKEMVKNGQEPSGGTYAALIRAYCRSRYVKDAIAVYREMKQKGFVLSTVLYNTLLSACADVGFVDEALEIFQEMKSSCTPDSWSFSSLITVHSCSGNVEEAEAALAEMMEAGFEPTIFVVTSIIQCYGKAGRVDDVVKTFDRMMELGITPDDRCISCLVNVLTQAPNELDKITSCIEKVNPKLGYIVKVITKEENIDGEIFKKEASELLEAIDPDVKKALCNCLLDLCVTLNQLQRACELLQLGLSLGIYSNILSITPTQWSLHLKSLSLGAALTSLHIWMNDLSKALEDGEELPPLLGINTGHGKHKFSDKGLAAVFESHLKELNAPFHEAPDRVGWFLTTKVAATSWLESRRLQDAVAL